MLLLKAQKYLEIVRNRGKAQSTLRRVYYNIVNNIELFLLAYTNLYANDGSMTAGINPDDTVDGMSVKRIETLMKKLKKRAPKVYGKIKKIKKISGNPVFKVVRGGVENWEKKS